MPDAPSSTPARTRRSWFPRSRRGQAAVIGITVLAVVAVGAVMALTMGGDDTAAHQAAATTTVPPTSIALELAPVSTISAGKETSLPAEQANQILTVVRQYVGTATVATLRNAVPVGDLSGVFSGSVLPAVLGADRAVLVDEGLPKVSGALTVTGAPVQLYGLGDSDGRLLLVTAKIELQIVGRVASAGDVQIKRSGELVLVPDAGGWRVAGYDLTVSRAGAGVDPPTTRAATSTTRR